MDNTAIKALVVLAASGLMFGCATTGQEEMRSELDEVRALAEKAAADAAAAREATGAAQATASEALDTAASAKAQSEQTEAKIDRMFKKAMYK
jgi:murein lipoprotein